MAASNDWRDDARCRPTVHKRPEIFYPLGLDKGESDTAGIAIAKEFCAACPVREECLDEALRLGERWGVWGGMTPAERIQLRIRRILVAEAVQQPPAPPTQPDQEGSEPKRRCGRPPQTKCKRQHPLTGENLWLDRKGHKICRICHANRQMQVRARRREKAVAG